jgi:hypothetical protein
MSCSTALSPARAPPVFLFPVPFRRRYAESIYVEKELERGTLVAPWPDSEQLSKTFCLVKPLETFIPVSSGLTRQNVLLNCSESGQGATSVPLSSSFRRKGTGKRNTGGALAGLRAVEQDILSGQTAGNRNPARAPPVFLFPVPFRRRYAESWLRPGPPTRQPEPFHDRTQSS